MSFIEKVSETTWVCTRVVYFARCNEPSAEEVSQTKGILSRICLHNSAQDTFCKCRVFTLHLAKAATPSKENCEAKGESRDTRHFRSVVGNKVLEKGCDRMGHKDDVRMDNKTYCGLNK